MWEMCNSYQHKEYNLWHLGRETHRISLHDLEVITLYVVYCCFHSTQNSISLAARRDSFVICTITAPIQVQINYWQVYRADKPDKNTTKVPADKSLATGSDYEQCGGVCVCVCVCVGA
jgi:hypothetical protein